MKKVFNRDLWVDLFFDIIGCFIYGVGVQSLSAPNNLPPGGVTGISVIINYLTGLRISALSFLINIPLLVLAWFFLGKRFTLKTMKTVVILTLSLELCARFIPPYSGELILIAIFAGVLQGVGLGLVFMRGSTTGGIDIISKLIQLKYTHFPIGKLILFFDGVVLVVTAFVYKNIGTAMYALILAFACSRTIDGIVYGLDKGRAILIISEKYQEIYKEIDFELGRGSTILKGVGSYTGIDRPVLLCAVSLEQFHPLKRIVTSIDPNAFVVSMETDEILGEGFKPLDTV